MPIKPEKAELRVEYKMATRYDVPINDLIEKVGEELKRIPEIEPPVWAAYAKTGIHKERPPTREDWWHIRAAAVLHSVRKLGPVGVAKLRTKYGGKKNRGHKPEKFYKGSGNILRKVLQQLEKAGLVKQVEKGVHKGRIITPKGVSLMDKSSSGLLKTAPRPVEPKKEEPKKEPKKEAKPEEKKAPKPSEPKKEAKPAQLKKEEPKKEAKPVEPKKESSVSEPVKEKKEIKKEEPKKKEKKEAPKEAKPQKAAEEPKKNE